MNRSMPVQTWNRNLQVSSGHAPVVVRMDTMPTSFRREAVAFEIFTSSANPQKTRSKQKVPRRTNSKKKILEHDKDLESPEFSGVPLYESPRRKPRATAVSRRHSADATPRPRLTPVMRSKSSKSPTTSPFKVIRSSSQKCPVTPRRGSADGSSDSAGTPTTWTGGSGSVSSSSPMRTTPIKRLSLKSSSRGSARNMTMITPTTPRRVPIGAALSVVSSEDGDDSTVFTEIDFDKPRIEDIREKQVPQHFAVLQKTSKTPIQAEATPGNRRRRLSAGDQLASARSSPRAKVREQQPRRLSVDSNSEFIDDFQAWSNHEPKNVDQYLLKPENIQVVPSHEPRELMSFPIVDDRALPTNSQRQDMMNEILSAKRERRTPQRPRSQLRQKQVLEELILKKQRQPRNDRQHAKPPTPPRRRPRLPPSPKKRPKKQQLPSSELQIADLAVSDNDWGSDRFENSIGLADGNEFPASFSEFATTTQQQNEFQTSFSDLAASGGSGTFDEFDASFEASFSNIQMQHRYD